MQTGPSRIETSSDVDSKTRLLDTHVAGIWVLLALAIVLVYWPVASSTFAYGDDFAIFFDGESEVEEFVSAGRPGLVLAELTIHRLVDEIRDLRLLRSISILGAIVLASVYFVLARRWFTNPIVALCFPIAMLMLPSVQEYVAAAHNWSFTWIAALSSTAALVAHRGFLDSHSAKSRWFAILCSFLMMEAALLTYQPAAMWFWPATLFFVLDSRFLTSADYRRATLRSIVAGLAFIALGFAAMKLILYFSQITIQDRGQLMTNPLTKLYWFARMQLTQGLNLWQIYSGNRYLMLATSAFTSALILAGFCVESGRQRRAGGKPLTLIVQVCSALVVLLASHCHWLVVVNMTQNYRVAGALCATVFIAVAWSVSRLVANFVPPDRRPRFEVVLFVAVTVLAMLKCQSNLQHYFVDPYRTAYRYVVDSLQSQLAPDTTHVHLIRQRREDGLITEELTQPFGWPFSMWTTDGLVETALKDAGVPHRVREITVGEKGEPIPGTPGTVVVDMGKLKELRATR